MSDKLKSSLRRLGAAGLARLVGDATLEAVDNILNEGLTESRMVDLLLNRNGTQILAVSSIRKAVLSQLDEEDLSFVHYGSENKIKSVDLRSKNITWNRNSVKSQRLVKCLELGSDYLPPEINLTAPCEEIGITFPLHKYQKRIKDRGGELLAPPRSKLLIHMPTGAGKTKTSAELLVDFWRSQAKDDGYIVWLAHSEELCVQASETLSAIWAGRGDYPLSLYRLWGNIELPDQIKPSGIVVASLQRMYAMWSSDQSDQYRMVHQLREKCRIIVIDEAHRAIAPTYKDAIEAITNLTDTRVLGLTATPGRGKDPLENQKLARFFDNKKITLQNEGGEDLPDPIGYLQKYNFLATIKRRPVPTDVEIDLTEKERKHLETFLDLPASALKRLGENEKRNALILSEIARLNDKGYTVIVFACSVEHSRMISDLCRLRGIGARSIDGETSRKDRKTWIEQYKQGEFRVLVNYGVLTTGFDAPNTNSVLISRPTASIVLYSQMIGRGIRGVRMGGNEECLLVDLEDNLRDFPSESYAFNYFQW